MVEARRSKNMAQLDSNSTSFTNGNISTIFETSIRVICDSGWEKKRQTCHSKIGYYLDTSPQLQVYQTDLQQKGEKKCTHIYWVFCRLPWSLQLVPRFKNWKNRWNLDDSFIDPEKNLHKRGIFLVVAFVSCLNNNMNIWLVTQYMTQDVEPKHK